MAGDDTSSEDFVKNYDSAAAEAVAAFAELTTAYGNLAIVTSTGLGAPAGATGAGRSISPRFIDHLLDTVRPSTVTTPQGAIRQIYESGGVRIVTEDNIVITVITRAG